MTEITNLLSTLVISGSELRSLMRKHKMTIKSLAVTMGISQTVIRRRLNGAGVSGASVLDWTEAITGSLPGRYRAALRSWRRQQNEEAQWELAN